MIDLEAFDALSFDCYGTLVDWERGILDAVRPSLAERGLEPDGEEVLERFARLESNAERGPWRSYRAVLTAVFRDLAQELGFDARPEEAAAFAHSVGLWPPFPDSEAMLRRLATRYRLAIVSNVDDDLFARTRARLGVRFDAVVTAEQVRSYKPAPAHFHELLRRLALPRERILHVAQSLYHDIAPASRLGFTCVWVNRRAGRPGGGATAPAQAVPALEVASLEALVERAGLAG